MIRSLHLVAALLAALTLTACHRAGAWPEDGKRAFISTCEKKNPANGACACVASALEKTMTWAEFQAFQDAKAGHAPPPAKMAKVREAVAACNPEAK